MANMGALKELRRVIKAVDADKLHMAKFVDYDAECGTAYCAAGWACKDEWFRAHGLLFDEEIDAPKMGGYPGGFKSLAWFFELNEEDCSRLFGGNLICGGMNPHQVSKKEVLDNINRLLNGEGAVEYKACRQ